MTEPENTEITQILYNYSVPSVNKCHIKYMSSNGQIKKVKFTVDIICHNMLHKVNTVILTVLVNTITSIQQVQNVKHEYTIP